MQSFAVRIFSPAAHTRFTSCNQFDHIGFRLSMEESLSCLFSFPHRYPLGDSLLCFCARSVHLFLHTRYFLVHFPGQRSHLRTVLKTVTYQYALTVSGFLGFVIDKQRMERENSKTNKIVHVLVHYVVFFNVFLDRAFGTKDEVENLKNKEMREFEM